MLKNPIKLLYLFLNIALFASVKRFHKKYFNHLARTIKDEHDILNALVNTSIEEKTEYIKHTSRLKRIPLQLLEHERTSIIDVPSTITPQRSSRAILRDYADPRFSKNISIYNYTDIKTVGV